MNIKEFEQRLYDIEICHSPRERSLKPPATNAAATDGARPRPERPARLVQSGARR